GLEGSEGTVVHVADGSFQVGEPHLELVKSHAGDFTAGAPGSYTLAVHNNASAVSGTTTVVDELPAGLTYVGAGSGGTGWSCGAMGQVVTCTSTESVAGGGDFPGLTINVSVDLAAPAALDNVATVANAGVEGGAAVSGNTDAATILHPDLSTSTM